VGHQAHDIELWAIGVLGAFLLIPCQRLLEPHPVLLGIVLVVVWAPLMPTLIALLLEFVILPTLQRVRMVQPQRLRIASKATSSSAPLPTDNWRRRWETMKELHSVTLLLTGVTALLIRAVVMFLRWPF